VHLVSDSRIATSGSLARDKAVELLLQHHPGAKVPCRPYKGVTEPDMLALYPLVLTTPDYPDYPLPGDSFDYTRIRRYCTNSGTALGLGLSNNRGWGVL